jgi:hypothetical protein
MTRILAEASDVAATKGEETTMRADNEMPREGKVPSEDSTVWIETLLRATAPGGFLPACEAASRDGLMLLKLRQAEQHRPAALLQPAPTYLRSLAQAARVSLEAVARWARLPSDLRLVRDFGAGWGRLTLALGWDPSVALLRLRLAFAEEAGDLVLPLARRAPARPGAGQPPASPSATLAALAASEAGWDLELRGRLHECEAGFRDACGLV